MLRYDRQTHAFIRKGLKIYLVETFDLVGKFYSNSFRDVIRLTPFGKIEYLYLYQYFTLSLNWH